MENSFRYSCYCSAILDLNRNAFELKKLYMLDLAIER